MELLTERLTKFGKSSKIIKLFNPNDSRSEFGCPLRLCINTYVGCSHQCSYCYNHWMKGMDISIDKIYGALRVDALVKSHATTLSLSL